LAGRVDNWFVGQDEEKDLSEYLPSWSSLIFPGRAMTKNIALVQMQNAQRFLIGKTQNAQHEAKGTAASYPHSLFLASCLSSIVLLDKWHIMDGPWLAPPIQASLLSIQLRLYVPVLLISPSDLLAVLASWAFSCKSSTHAFAFRVEMRGAIFFGHPEHLTASRLDTIRQWKHALHSGLLTIVTDEGRCTTATDALLLQGTSEWWTRCDCFNPFLSLPHQC
jgi:hypothetical protein